MKRGMAGGAHRGPVGVGRQRRTIRIIQTLLVLGAAAALMFAGYSLGRARGLDEAADRTELDAARRPGGAQTVVLVILGAASLGAALYLQGEGGVRLLTPARLIEMERRGEIGPIPVEEEESKDPA